MEGSTSCFGHQKLWSFNVFNLIAVSLFFGLKVYLNIQKNMVDSNPLIL